MEQDLIPPEPAVASPASSLVDGRGWVMAVVAMVVIGVWTLRPAPAPSEPGRISAATSEPWMADALPGVGVKTRDEQWRRIRAGAIEALPERARAIAREVFTWPDPHPTTGSSRPSRP